MPISNTGHGRIYINQIDDTAKTGKSNKPKGAYKHSRLIGRIFSWFNGSFHDKEAGWMNKKSTIHYLQRNSAQIAQLDSTQLNDINNLKNSSTAAEVKRLFKIVKGLKTPEPVKNAKSDVKEKDLFPGVTSVKIELNDKTFDYEGMKKYLFSEFEDYEKLKANPPKKLTENEKSLMEYPPREANKALLEASYRNFILPEHITYHLVQPENKVNEIWEQPIPAQKIQLEFRKEFFKYDEENHCYIDFAHATTFGGAYRTFGCVQEERMFCEFGELAILDFMTKDSGSVHPCVDKDGGHEGYPPDTEPQPFIVEGIRATNNLDGVKYGGALHKMTPDAVKAGVKPLADSPPVDVLGIAAMDWRNVEGNNRKYTIEQIKYMFGAAYLGFDGANKIAQARGQPKAIVHTAPWGCGAFQNSFNTIIAIQCLAAQIAGVDLVFHDVKDSTPFNQKNINEINSVIGNLISLKGHPAHMFDYINDGQTGPEKEKWLPQ